MDPDFWETDQWPKLDKFKQAVHYMYMYAVVRPIK